MEDIGRRRIRVGRWNWHLVGSRTPLLVLNGIGMNMEVLAPLAEGLAERPVLMFDAPGIGGSPEPLVPYTAGMAAGWGVELLDRFGIDKTDLLGFSWGGAIAQQMALRHGRRVGRLIVSAIGPGLPMVPGKPAILTHLADPHWLRDLREHPKRVAFFGLGGSDRTVLTREFLKRLILPGTRGYLYQFGALCGWSGTLALPFLNKPTLVVMGEDDQIVPLANGRLLAALIPGARLEVIEGAGHLLMFSHQQEFLRLLREFLSSDKLLQMRAA
jgi:pimeloyl-ACP methyl ester carboxylesterase